MLLWIITTAAAPPIPLLLTPIPLLPRRLPPIPLLPRRLPLLLTPIPLLPRRLPPIPLLPRRLPPIPLLFHRLPPYQIPPLSTPRLYQSPTLSQTPPLSLISYSFPAITLYGMYALTVLPAEISGNQGSEIMSVKYMGISTMLATYVKTGLKTRLTLININEGNSNPLVLVEATPASTPASLRRFKYRFEFIEMQGSGRETFGGQLASPFGCMLGPSYGHNGSPFEPTIFGAQSCPFDPGGSPFGPRRNQLHIRNGCNRVNGSSSSIRSQPQVHNFIFQSSSVTYGGASGPYYTSSTTRRSGSDGLTFEEHKEANAATRQAAHRISKGIHQKDRSVTRKLNSDGRVRTTQTLHNVNEVKDELAGFEETWKGNAAKQLPGWSGAMNVHGHIGSGSSAQHLSSRGGWALPSTGGSNQYAIMSPESRDVEGHPHSHNAVRTNSGVGKRKGSASGF